MKVFQGSAKKKRKPAPKAAAAVAAAGDEGGKKEDKRFALQHADPRFQMRDERQGKGKVKAKKPDATRFKKLEAIEKARPLVDSRGVPLEVKKPRGRRRDLASTAAPKTLKEFYAAEQGVEEVEEEEEEEAMRSGAESELSDDQVSLGSDLWDEMKGEEELIDATKRIAVKNCDWDHIGATTLYALLQSFCPMGGAIRRVDIHTSEFGKEQLAREEKQGPNIWVKPGEVDDAEVASDEDSTKVDPINDENDPLDSDNEDEESYNFDDDDEAIRHDVGPDGEKFSENKYRRYELQRLKYFYAVAEFDSVATAMHVFRECDGAEIGRSGCTFDLSFVPDDMSFDEPKDSCTRLPPGFRGGERFVTNALQNSRFAISWDQTDPKRKKAIADAFRDETMDDIEAYLAPASSDEDEGEKKSVKDIRKKYSVLFEDIGGLPEDLPEDAHKGGGEEEKGEEEEGIEVDWGESGDEGKNEEDVEGEEGEEGDEEEEDTDDEDLVRRQLAEIDSDSANEGDMEAVIDLGVKDASKNLRDALLRKEARKNETVWEARMRKKREGRKLAKKDKARQREEENNDDEEVEAATAEKLRSIVGEEPSDDEDNEKPRPKGKKDKRKLHKQKKVAAAKAEREAKKSKRIAEIAATAPKRTAPEKEEQQEGTASKLLQRFSKLSDPRFMPDPTHPKYKRDRTMADLEDEIRKERKKPKKREAPVQDAEATSVDVSSTVDYFKKKAMQK